MCVFLRKCGRARVVKMDGATPRPCIEQKNKARTSVIFLHGLSNFAALTCAIATRKNSCCVEFWVNWTTCPLVFTSIFLYFDICLLFCSWQSSEYRAPIHEGEAGRRCSVYVADAYPDPERKRRQYSYPGRFPGSHESRAFCQ